MERIIPCRPFAVTPLLLWFVCTAAHKHSLVDNFGAQHNTDLLLDKLLDNLDTSNTLESTQTFNSSSSNVVSTSLSKQKDTKALQNKALKERKRQAEKHKQVTHISIINAPLTNSA